MTDKNKSSSETPAGAGALSHLRVLDLSRILAGPWATQTLADLGAEVIKVESRKGDDTRRWGPPFMPDANGDSGDAAYFSACNRNKKSITVDFSRDEGAELVRQLACKSDVFIENFKVGGLRQYGLDYTTLKALNPALVYCSITGFGQTGPYAHRAGYDFLIQGMGGLMSITGQPSGTPGAEPLKVGVAITDLFTGMYAATSILAAINHRDRTGEGQYIDCSLLDSQTAMLANQAANWLNGNINPGCMGNNHPNIVPYRAFAASDGHVIITCGNDDQFRRLCHALDLADMADNPAYATNSDRVRERETVDSLLAARLATFSQRELISLLEKVNVPCGPINTVQEVFAEPHVQSREMEVHTPRADGSDVTTVGFPAKLSATPASYRRAPPTLGEDTDEVLRELLSIDQKEIDQMRQTLLI